MDEHGGSLFQGVGSIHLNHNDEEQLRAEEEEEELDRQRRHAQIATDLVGAFDDVDCDDDTINSLNCQSNFSDGADDGDDDDDDGRSGERPPAPTIVPSPKVAFRHDDGPAGSRELRLLLESKSREFEHVTRKLHDKDHAHEQALGELRKKLLLEQAEKDRAIMTRDQTKELLVQSKTKISELEDANAKLRVKITGLEDRNVALEGQMEQKNMMLQDSLHRYRMLEQNATQKADRHTDALVKQAEERHNAKMAMMQQQIDNLRGELDERQQECRRLEARYGELQKSREALLIEKSDTVQRLQDQLEDSQRQCGNLLSKSKHQGDFEQERLRMRSRINALEQEHSGMQQTINELTNRLEKTNAELELMDSLVHGQQPDGAAEETAMDGKKTATMAGHADATSYGFAHRNLIGSTPNTVRGRAGTGGGGGDGDNRAVRLKNELLVCMTGQKEKRETIRHLEQALQAKDHELEQLKKDESEALVQMTQYKEEAFRLASKCKILEQEMEKVSPEAAGNRSTRAGSNRSTAGRGRRTSAELHQEALEDKIFSLQQGKLEADERVEQLEQETEQLAAKCRTLSAELTSCASLKLEVGKQKFLLADAQSECDRLKRLYIEVSGTKDELGRELATLRAQDSAKQIAALQEQVVSLERALQLAELKSSELAKMLDKEKTGHETLLKQLQAGDGQRQHHATPSREGKHAANSCTKCIDGIAQISKLEIENLKMQSTCSTYLREMGELKMQLNEHQATIVELHNRLDLKAERDQLIDELKEKAAQFEQIIRSQISTNSSSSATCDSATSPHRQVAAFRDQSVGTSDEGAPEPEQRAAEAPTVERRRSSSSAAAEEAAEARRLAREQEQRVREEMARVFAGQIKQIEERFRAQFVRFEENIDTLKNELYERVTELKVRTQEVEVLKCAIVTEREKIGELLAQKDADARALFDKQADLMGKYKAELANGQKKVQFLERELQEKRELVANERQSMEKLIAQITAERTMYREREQEITAKFQEIEAEYQKGLDLVTEKYQSAKKTALNYKKYAEDKEQHMLKEYDRIKEGYNAALLKVQNRMKEALENKERNLRDKIAKLEAEYESKLQLVRQGS